MTRLRRYSRAPRGRRRAHRAPRRRGAAATLAAIRSPKTVAALSVLLLSLATAAPAEAFSGPAGADVGTRSSVPHGGPRPAQGSITARGVAEEVHRDALDVRSQAAGDGPRTAGTFVNDSAWAVQWPFPVRVPITARFGPRIAPTAGASSDHKGVDFAPGAGTPIHIVADGVVHTVTGNDNSCGVHVVVDHVIRGRAVSSVYCHMSQGSVRVAVGQRVHVGDVVGAVGNTGVSTGAHLHFEIRLDGTTAVDPLAWLTANTG